MRTHLNAMPKKLFKKLFPQLDHLRENQSLAMFGRASRDPNLWHINRRSVARAFAVGFFTAFIPIPAQMIIAAGLAIIFRANIPISVILVWVTNPITVPAIFYTAYKFGTILMNVHLEPFQFEFSLNWLFTGLQDRWQPFLVGCLCSGALAGAEGYGMIQLYWRLYVSKVWSKRKLQHSKKLNHANRN